MGQSVQQNVRTSGKGSLALALARPRIVARDQLVQPPLHRFAAEPIGHRIGSKLDQDAFTAILHRRKPRRLQGDCSALDFAVVLAVHVRHDRLQPREPGQRQHFPQPMNLNDGFDGVEPRRVAPYGLRQATRMEVGFDGCIVCVAFRDGQQSIQLRVLDGTFPGRAARTPGRDRVQHFPVGERRQAVRHVGKLFMTPRAFASLTTWRRSHSASTA